MFSTSLFAAGGWMASGAPPPVPAISSRIPPAVSTEPSGAIGAKRSYWRAWAFTTTSAPYRYRMSQKGLTPGVAYHLAQCCHPIPGDRIVGLRREDEEIEVHVIGCDTLASGVDADWLDLAWGEGSDGGAARLSVILRDVPGALGTMAGILGTKHANIVNLHLVHRDGSFQTFHVDVEVHDLAHLHAIIAALRGADPVSSVERI